MAARQHRGADESTRDPLAEDIPIPEDLPDDPETQRLLARVATGHVEGPAGIPREEANDLTPETLLGDHRDGRWTARPEEAEAGLEDEGYDPAYDEGD